MASMILVLEKTMATLGFIWLNDIWIYWFYDSILKSFS